MVRSKIQIGHWNESIEEGVYQKILVGILSRCFSFPLVSNYDFSESRYLLVLTENYAALPILQQKLLEMRDTVIIFGSSFPKDQEYTQVSLLMQIGATGIAFKRDEGAGKNVTPPSIILHRTHPLPPLIHLGGGGHA